MANYPSDDELPSAAPVEPCRAPTAGCLRSTSGRRPDTGPTRRASATRAGEKITVTRVAAQRSREMGSRMYGLFHRAATADGADKSGLTALT